jgi:hypothetical protein
VNQIDDAIERVQKVRERLDAAMSVYGPVGQHRVVTQAAIDEIAAARSELEGAVIDKDRVLGKRELVGLQGFLGGGSFFNALQ